MKKGFTIIELLVVSAVIALIASILSATVVGTRARSRDARREVDIKEIQNAVNLYAVNNRTFPVCGTAAVVNGSTDCLSTLLLVAGAMSQVPVDPLGGANGVSADCSVSPTAYIYCYVSDGASYNVHYRLETGFIPGKVAGWQLAGP